MKSDVVTTNLEMAEELGISKREFDHVCAKLNRNPNFAELGIFSAMFSEHCSYKSSKKFLKKLPTKGERVLQGPGENAGILDIGGGWAIAFKVESHNHPSYIEPYQGAATGVGGILRDIFTMGARPVAAMNGLCFGEQKHPRTPDLVRGVVKGIGDYGNSFGVPTIAGQTTFHPTYNGNCLVNAFTLGVVEHKNIFKGCAKGIGNAVVYVGAKTGRDGVHGATMASKEFSTSEDPDRPAVQVGDPFTEKLLLESTLECMKAGLIIGIQDMGAAGITSSSFEMAHRAGTGLQINLDKIPTREAQMSAYELLLSESQERMLLVCDPGNVKKLQAVYEKWDLHADVVGEVIEGDRVVMHHQGEKVVDLPVSLVADPLEAELSQAIESEQKALWNYDETKLPLASFKEKCEKALESFSFADPKHVYEQYDSTVGVRTLSEPFADSGVVRLREIENRNVLLSMKLDCNPTVSFLYPKEGGRRAVAESALNVALSGATPIGATNCLNFGSPNNPLVLKQFSDTVDGMAEACNALSIPIISGNVSLYNDTDGQAIYPTPMVGVVGMAEGAFRPVGPHLKDPNLEIAIVGQRRGGLGGSHFLSSWFGKDCGRPDDTELSLVKRAIDFCTHMQKESLVSGIHDVSSGGALISLIEMSLFGVVGNSNPIGFQLSVSAVEDLTELFFGESLPRILVAFNPAQKEKIATLSAEFGLDFLLLGHTENSSHLVIRYGVDSALDLNLKNVYESWSQKWKGLF